MLIKFRFRFLRGEEGDIIIAPLFSYSSLFILLFYYYCGYCIIEIITCCIPAHNVTQHSF